MVDGGTIKKHLVLCPHSVLFEPVSSNTAQLGIDFNSF